MLQIFILTISLLGALASTQNSLCQLTILKGNQDSTLEGTKIKMYISGYSSPAHNLHGHIFNLFQGNPIDGCSEIMQPDSIQQEQMGTQDYNYLIVIDGDAGVCGVTKRIQMAKNVGAKGVIITELNSDHAEQSYKKFDDSTFFVFIVKEEQSINLLLQNSFMVGELSSLHSSSKGQANIWISSINKDSYQLLKIWDQTVKDIPSLSNQVSWTPRYALWGCSGSTCELEEQAEYISKCACRGQFCSPETHENQAGMAVKEDVRQKIIFQNFDNKQYMFYMSEFLKKCLSKLEQEGYVEDCVESVLIKIGIQPAQVNKKVEEFLATCEGNIYESMILDRNRFVQLGYYPVFVLNREIIDYKGKHDLQVQLCRKLGMEKSEGCSKILNEHSTIQTNYSVWILVFLVAVLLAVAVVVIKCYKKSLKKQMNKEVKMQVSTSVQHYFALNETK